LRHASLLAMTGDCTQSQKSILAHQILVLDITITNSDSNMGVGGAGDNPQLYA